MPDFKFMPSAVISVGNSASNSGLNTGGFGVSRSFLHRLSIMGLLETYLYQTLAVLVFGCILFRQLKKSRSGNPKSLPLPPGPKGYPLIGSLFEMPIVKPWLVYDEWCKTYGRSFKLMIDSLSSQRFINFYTVGDIVYFNVLGQHFLILSTLERMSEKSKMTNLCKWELICAY
jgi:hypothetical protein